MADAEHQASGEVGDPEHLITLNSLGQPDYSAYNIEIARVSSKPAPLPELPRSDSTEIEIYTYFEREEVRSLPSTVLRELHEEVKFWSANQQNIEGDKASFILDRVQRTRNLLESGYKDKREYLDVQSRAYNEQILQDSLERALTPSQGESLDVQEAKRRLSCVARGNLDMNGLQALNNMGVGGHKAGDKGLALFANILKKGATVQKFKEMGWNFSVSGEGGDEFGYGIVSSEPLKREDLAQFGSELLKEVESIQDAKDLLDYENADLEAIRKRVEKQAAEQGKAAATEFRITTAIGITRADDAFESVKFDPAKSFSENVKQIRNELFRSADMKTAQNKADFKRRLEQTDPFLATLYKRGDVEGLSELLTSTRGEVTELRRTILQLQPSVPASLLNQENVVDVDEVTGLSPSAENIFIGESAAENKQKVQLNLDIFKDLPGDSVPVLEKETDTNPGINDLLQDTPPDIANEILEDVRTARLLGKSESELIARTVNKKQQFDQIYKDPREYMDMFARNHIERVMKRKIGEVLNDETAKPEDLQNIVRIGLDAAGIKSINDTMGHGAGNVGFKAISETLKGGRKVTISRQTDQGIESIVIDGYARRTINSLRIEIDSAIEGGDEFGLLVDARNTGSFSGGQFEQNVRFLENLFIKDLESVNAEGLVDWNHPSLVSFEETFGHKISPHAKFKIGLNAGSASMAEAVLRVDFSTCKDKGEAIQLVMNEMFRLADERSIEQKKNFKSILRKTDLDSYIAYARGSKEMMQREIEIVTNERDRLEAVAKRIREGGGTLPPAGVRR